MGLVSSLGCTLRGSWLLNREGIPLVIRVGRKKRRFGVPGVACWQECLVLMNEGKGVFGTQAAAQAPTQQMLERVWGMGTQYSSTWAQKCTHRHLTSIDIWADIKAQVFIWTHTVAYPGTCKCFRIHTF